MFLSVLPATSVFFNSLFIHLSFDQPKKNLSSLEIQTQTLFLTKHKSELTSWCTLRIALLHLVKKSSDFRNTLVPVSLFHRKNLQQQKNTAKWKLHCRPLGPPPLPLVEEISCQTPTCWSCVLDQSGMGAVTLLRWTIKCRPLHHVEWFPNIKSYHQVRVCQGEVSY